MLSGSWEQFLERSEFDPVRMPEALEPEIDFDALFHDGEVEYLFTDLIGPAGIYEMLGDALEIIRVNDLYYDLMAAQPGQIYQDTKDAFTHVWAEDQSVLIGACIQAKADGRVQTAVIRRINGRGQMLWLSLRIRFVGTRGEGSVFFFVIHDITKQKMLEEELRASREQHRQDELCRMLVEDSGMIIYDYDVLNDEMFYSIPAGNGMRRSWEIQRYSQYIKQSPLIHRDDVPLCLQHIQNMNYSTDRSEFEQQVDYFGDGYRWYRTSYRAMRNEEGVVYRTVGHAIDITEKRKWQERAEKDGLTGLLNRQTMENKVNSLLRRKQFRGVFFLFDIDDFKRVNDTCGHTIGDGLLMCVARIFEMKFRNEDLKCRLGGDELAVLTVNPMEEEHIMRRADDVLAAVRTLRDDMQLNVPISISVGIACADEGTWSFENLYQRADIALYRAKKEGKDQFYMI